LRVSLPSAAPFIATGFRIAAGFALIVSIGVEILTTFGEGLGTFIADAGTAPGGMDEILAAAAWAGTIGLLINLGLSRAERRLFRWHHVRQDGTR
jgi:NitT/TauT family transport system permease protein